MHCTDCGQLLVSGSEKTLHCPLHGVSMARIEHHALWDGEVVQIVCPTVAANGRYVVRFLTGKHRTVRANVLHPIEMKRPA